MRITGWVFAFAVLMALASPAQAKTASLTSHANANAQAADEQAEPKGCHAYQKGPDGSWVEMPCHEGGANATAPSRSKSTSH